MPHYQLFAVDMDGTLLNPANELTPPVGDALRRAKEAGIEVILVTGRRYGRTIGFALQLGLRSPIISASGALVKHPFEDHRTIFAAEFPRPVLVQIGRIIEREGYEPVFYGDSYAEGFDFYAARLAVEKPEFAEYLEKNQGLGRAWPGITREPPPSILAGFVMGTEQEMRELAAVLDRELPGELYVHVLRSPLYRGFMCEIAPAGVTKWTGIRRLADVWNIPAERIAAIGDDVNDLPMIRAAGLGIAMGNAVPEVLAAADRIAPRNDEDGLVAAVEWLLES